MSNEQNEPTADTDAGLQAIKEQCREMLKRARLAFAARRGTDEKILAVIDRGIADHDKAE